MERQRRMGLVFGLLVLDKSYLLEWRHLAISAERLLRRSLGEG